MKTHIRNLARLLMISVRAKNDREKLEKKGTLNLLLAFAVAAKHSLRFEFGPLYDDLYPLLMHLPEFKSYKPALDSDSDSDERRLELEISYHVSQQIYNYATRGQADPVTVTPMINTLSSIVDIMTNLDRIHSSPIPLAYAIHLRQTVLIYIIALPFQLISGMGYSTIPAVTFAAFTLLGIEAVKYTFFVN